MRSTVVVVLFICCCCCCLCCCYYPLLVHGLASSTTSTTTRRKTKNQKPNSRHSSSSARQSTTTTTTSKKRYRQLHHPPRQRDPWAVERDLPYKFILGSDESGTGCLAGPIVTVTCCCLGMTTSTTSTKTTHHNPLEKDDDSQSNKNNHKHHQPNHCWESRPSWFIEGVQDCKRLSRSERWRIYQQVLHHPDEYKWTIAIRSAEQVDQAPSISHAIADCFTESIGQLATQILDQTRTTMTTTTLDDDHHHHHHDNDEIGEDVILSIVDGPSSPKGLSIPSRPWIGGDNTVYTIALASILAQVTRDKIVVHDLAPLYPQYGFERHKGYGTAAHLTALTNFGPCPIHRQSCKVVRRLLRSSTTTTTRDRTLASSSSTTTTTTEQPPSVQPPNDGNNSTLTTISTLLRSTTTTTRNRTLASSSSTTTTTTEQPPSVQPPNDGNNSTLATISTTTQAKSSYAVVSPTTQSLDRGSFVSRLSMLLLTGAGQGGRLFQPQPAQATYTDPKTRILMPDPEEIANAIPKDWTLEDADNPFSSWYANQKRIGSNSGGSSSSSGNPNNKIDNQLFSRLDSSNDALFYKEDRFVEHVDEQAVQLMTNYIAQVLQTASENKNNKNKDGTTRLGISVLDLCSSWTSHIPSSLLLSSSSSSVRLDRVAGLGMNANELQANPSLTEWTVQDLNDNPILPYNTESFDVILLQLSIDYLIQPLQVCQELGRVCSHGGTIHILFSNRLFLSKAIALWTGADDVDHVYTVASYLHYCQPNLFGNIVAQDLSVRTKKKKNGGRIVGDPLYVVTATKMTTTSNNT